MAMHLRAISFIVVATVYGRACNHLAGLLPASNADHEATLAERDHFVVPCRIVRGEDKPDCSQIVLTSRLWLPLSP